jgi:hypothetical protein
MVTAQLLRSNAELGGNIIELLADRFGIVGGLFET